MEGEEKQTEDSIILKRTSTKDYWDTDWYMIWTVPDGEKTREKSAAAIAFASIVGLTTGMYRSFLGPSASTSFISRAGAFGSILGPSIVAASTYVYVTSQAAQWRGKSEPHNHAIGGAAAGAILGLKHKSLMKMAQRSLWLGIGGVLASQLVTLPAFEELKNGPPPKQLYAIGGRRWKTPTNLEHSST